MAPEPGAGFRILAHPADIGIAFQGPTMAAAFVQAAEGLRSLLVGDAPRRPVAEVHLHLGGEDRGELLYNWLSELIYRFDADQLIPDAVTIERLNDFELEAAVRIETYDPDRHDTPYYVKAVTFHQLELEGGPGGWHGQVYVDI
jgi:SHS2 domain-containing protein